MEIAVGVATGVVLFFLAGIFCLRWLLDKFNNNGIV